MTMSKCKEKPKRCNARAADDARESATPQVPPPLPLKPRLRSEPVSCLLPLLPSGHSVSLHHPNTSSAYCGRFGTDEMRCTSVNDDETCRLLTGVVDQWRSDGDQFDIALTDPMPKCLPSEGVGEGTIAG